MKSCEINGGNKEGIVWKKNATISNKGMREFRLEYLPNVVENQDENQGEKFHQQQRYQQNTSH